MSRRIRYAVYAALLIMVLGAFSFKLFQPVQVVPRIRLAPGFALIDQNGERLTNEDLRGDFVLYNFSYTHCPPPCYSLDQTMQEVQQRLPEVDLGDIPMKFVTISIDPARDTPAALQAYAQTVNADPGQWLFATTPDAGLLKTIIGGGFETYYRDHGDGTFDLDPVFILVDGWGIIRGEYRYKTRAADADRILRHIGVMAAELQNSDGAAKVAYEAAHLFLCYAQ